MKTLPLAEVRNRLSALVDEVARTHEAVTITRNGVPAAVVVSIEDYESIMETLALLNDPEDRDRLAEAEESVATGDVTTGEEMAELMRERVRRERGAGAA
ncbi:Prevent-host-death family protein [Carbonactinospora thermoautotrophica]|uniref:Antitoxin n=1 Tax=Carbonactinospora thermoautotrophica TaxID=1469144 RepID=A0A132MUV8_9ACTN|nr:type II toxin-antitoxin system Phd/YefM family antitoxin [Carbonactinospora thermoautotrophica]KWX01490.1 Prevent-host-death family protein [Carbonactinospora thermoautotrophica]